MLRIGLNIFKRKKIYLGLANSFLIEKLFFNHVNLIWYDLFIFMNPKKIQTPVKA